MKPSRFNYFFRVDGRASLAYNTLTTALVALDDREAALWKAFLADPRPDYFETDGLTEWRDQLLELGLVVPDDDDEMERLRRANEGTRQATRHLGLTIVPTLDCNFRCGYCFSYRRRQRMSREVQDALLRFVEGRLDRAGGLSIAWFGGEPTLCPAIIEGLSGRISAACADHGAEMLPATIVTNGYLLDAKMARRLAAAGVKNAQVTLDGDRETHDARRVLRDGRGTFDRILDNVAASCDLLKITIRVNLDRTNAGMAQGVLEALASRRLQGKLLVGFAQVKSYTEACAGLAGDCLADCDFGTIDLELTKEVFRRGFGWLPYPELRQEGHCGATFESYLVVAPDGLLFKCWADCSLGKAHSVGSLLCDEPSPQQAANLQRYLAWDPFALEPCRQCRLLPICMGGCPHLDMLPGAAPDCSKWKHTLPELIAMNYLLEKEMRRSAAAQPAAPGPR